MKREKHYMIDIETTGVDQKTDDILEIGIVEIETGFTVAANGTFWHPTGRVFHEVLYSDRKPESEFAKKHMKALYDRCNNTPGKHFLQLANEIRCFVHNLPSIDLENIDLEPKYFMGWNASNFDMPFMFLKGLLIPSYYQQVNGKDKLLGDAHYRVYEQTGSVQLIADMTGLDRKTIEALAMDLNPTGLKLPDGKEHDAIYDCYKQIIMQNGLIKIGRMNIQK